MLKDFWNRLKFLITYKPKDVKKELPQIAVDYIKQFQDVLAINSLREHVSWFGGQVIRFIKSYPSSVEYKDGVLRISVQVTSAVPGDWGDELFNAMYITENSLKLSVEKRQMVCIPEDYNLPEDLRSKEHFVSVNWLFHKRLENKETDRC